jgi:hypothetical protein
VILICSASDSSKIQDQKKAQKENFLDRELNPGLPGEWFYLKTGDVNRYTIG